MPEQTSPKKTRNVVDSEAADDAAAAAVPDVEATPKPTARKSSKRAPSLAEEAPLDAAAPTVTPLGAEPTAEPLAAGDAEVVVESSAVVVRDALGNIVAYGEIEISEELADDEASVEALEEELEEQLEDMVERLQADHPDYSPPPYTPAGAMNLFKGVADRLTPQQARDLANRAAGVMPGDLVKADTWKGLWYMANYAAQYQGDLLKRRLTGEYTTDAYGFDQEFYDEVKPLLDFLYSRYWRVEAHGIEHIPESGGALLAANHSGFIPWDALMIGLAVYREAVEPRLVRTLIPNWYPNLPFAALLLTKLGMVVSHPENGKRLLSEGELVLAFPEGDKGPSKSYKERYRMARFGRGGFAQMAIETGAPIVPVAVVGSEETHPVVGRADALGKPLGLPYLPVTTVLPLPAKWSITFESPIETESYGADAVHDLQLVTQVSDEVRAKIQGALYDQLKARKSIFLG